jgi:glycosyltransferase involved in cell wall biosynthesis
MADDSRLAEGTAMTQRLASIDVVLPTYNRARLLPRCVETFRAARKPPGIGIRLMIIDNNSDDETRRIGAEFVERYPDLVSYLFEPRQGRHHALNAGITASRADVIAFFDDDETLDPSWLEVIAREFADPAIDFIGGPYKPNWLAPAPAWLPSETAGPVGVVDWGPQRRRYGSKTFRAQFMGGNCAFRRHVFERVGLYSDRYMYGEDLEMFRRVIEAGFVGDYVPDLVISHDISARKLTRSYWRHWYYVEGRTDGKLTRDGRHPFAGKEILGIPRWMFRGIPETALRRVGFALRRDGVQGFAAECALLKMLGYLRGRLLTVPERYFDRSGQRGT